MSKSKMDERCPRSLKLSPNSWCPLAVMRLKAIRNAGKELTEEEENKLPGCSWAIDHQLANYCFFKYIEEFCDNKNVSDVELASLLNVSVDTIKKIEKSALSKLKINESFSAIKATGDPLVTEEDETSTYKVHK